MREGSQDIWGGGRQYVGEGRCVGRREVVGERGKMCGKREVVCRRGKWHVREGRYVGPRREMVEGRCQVERYWHASGSAF